MAVRSSLSGGSGLTNIIPPQEPEDITQQTGAVLKDATTGEIQKVYPTFKEAQEEFKVVYGGAEAPSKPSLLPSLSSAIASGAVGAVQGSSLGGSAGAIIGGTLGALGVISSLQSAQDQANKAFLNDPERVTTSALEAYTDEKTGKVSYRVNKEIAAKGNTLSGSYAKSIQMTPEGDPVSWGDDGRLKINVSDAFASSDTYKELVDNIKTDYAALTKELDEANEGQYLKELNDYVSGMQSQYLYNQQAAANFEQKFPGATTEAINIGINNQRIGYAQNDDLDADYKLTIVENGVLVTKSAKDIFDTVYNYGGDKIAKDQYMAQLSSIVNDPTVNADFRAVTQGVINAIYGASNRDAKKSKYSGMLQKDFWDYVGTNIPIAGFTINEIVKVATGGESYGDMNYLYDNDLWMSIATLGGAATNVTTSMLAMNGIETAMRHIPGLSKLSAIAPSGRATFGFKEAAIGFGFNAASDAVYDSLKFAIKTSAGTDDWSNFWSEYMQDLAMDIVVSGASTLEFKLGMSTRGIDVATVKDAAGWTVDNSKITETTDANGKQIVEIVDETRNIDSGLGKDLSESMTKAVNSQIAGTLQNERIRKIYQKLNDKNIALRELGFEATGITGDNGYLMKISENAQDITALIQKQSSDYFSGKVVKNAEAHHKSMLNAVEVILGKNDTLSKIQDNYLIAKQQMNRYTQDLKNNLITEKMFATAEGFYNKFIEAVPQAQRASLDRLYDDIARVSSDLNIFREAKGLLSGDDIDRVERYDNYIPLWRDNTGEDFGTFIPRTQWKRDIRTQKNLNVLQSPENIQSPLLSVEQMLTKVMENAARSEQVLALKQTMDAVPDLGVTYATDPETNDVFKELTNAELMLRYSVPEADQKKIKKNADNPIRYKRALDKLDNDNKITANIQEYADARKAYNDAARSLTTTQGESIGDPFLGKAVGAYTKGMTLDDMNAHFLDVMSTSLEGMLNDAAKSETKKGFPKLDQESAYTRTMQLMKEAVESAEFNADELAKIMSELVRTARPFHSEKALSVEWIKENSEAYLSEKLSDPEFIAGNRAFDMDSNQFIQTKPEGYAVQYYAGGKKTTIYLNGVDEKHKQIAKEVADILNLPMSYKQKNAVAKLFTGMARLKRNTITALDPTRALPNLSRDQTRALVSSGGDYLAANDWLKLMADVASDFGYSKDQISQAYADIDRLYRQNAGLTQESIIRGQGKDAIQSAIQAANAPQAPSAEFKANANMLQRTAASLKYQFNVFKYDVENFTKGGAGRLATRVGDIAESYTRNRAAEAAYAAKLVEGLNSGKSLEASMEDAFTAGSWAGRVTTTSFGTKGAWTEAAAKYAPYAFSPFSSRASQIEAFAVNPLGVTVQTAGFMLGYTMSLASILAEEESRKKYLNLDDYTRSNNILIPIDNGAIITLPLDEELAGYVSPIRTLLESLSTQAPVSFWTVIGAFADNSSFDLSGFTEGDKFNLWRGIEKGLSSYAPSLLTAAGEIATGRDWYYGSSLEIDDQYLAAYGLSADGAGDYTTTGKNSKTLHDIADVLNIPQWMIQQAVESIGGNVGQYALYVLDKLRGATAEEQNVGGKDPIMAAVKPFTGADAQNIKSEFYNGISELKKEKTKLLTKLASNKKAQTTATGSDLTNLQKEHTKLIQDFVAKAGQWVNQYLTIFEMTGGLEYSQAMQVYYLFDFSDNFEGATFSVGTAGDYYADKLGTQEYYQQISNAARILDTNYDQSMRVYKAADGTFQTGTPYGLKAAQNSQYNLGATHTAALNNLIQKSDAKNEISNLRSAYYEYQNKMYAGGRKPTDAEYDKLDAMALQIDAKVTEVLLPYFKQNGLSVLNNSQVVDYLDNYYIVPGDYMVNNKGRYISASRLNKQRGFAKSYIQSVLSKMGVK